MVCLYTVVGNPLLTSGYREFISLFILFFFKPDGEGAEAVAVTVFQVHKMRTIIGPLPPPPIFFVVDKSILRLHPGSTTGI